MELLGKVKGPKGTPWVYWGYRLSSNHVCYKLEQFSEIATCTVENGM